MRNLKLVVNNKNNKLKREIFFVKKELQTILNLYAKMVSNGSWKFYGLSLESKVVSFDVYQRSSEKPVFRIIKNFKPHHFNEKFMVIDKNGNTIKKSENLNRLIDKTEWNNLRIVK